MNTVRVQWPQRSYEHAMSLKGKVSARRAEEETGIPEMTIYYWWKGTRPLFKGKVQNQPTLENCRRGHPLRGDNITHLTNGHRQCRKCRLDAQRKWGYRMRGTFHPVHNPDPALAPLTQLWFPTKHVRDTIRLHHKDEESLYVAIGGGKTASARIWRGIRRLETTWTRADRADRLLTQLRIPMVELGDPTYSPQVPDEEAA